MADKKFGESIQRHRNILGLTQQELSDRLGLKNKSTLGTWEAGKSEPDYKMIAKLCRELHIDANTLFEWDHTPVILAPNADSTEMVSLQGHDLSDAIAQFAKLPEEAAGELKIIFDYLDYKYNKRRPE